MKATSKWLMIPPAVAMLILLGPLSMQAGSSKTVTSDGPPATAAATEEAKSTARAVPALPRTPDLWQMSSALVGVLLLGVGGILVLRRLRGGRAPARGSTLVTLRQTLRLGRHAVHVLEFDDRILLVGEHERGLALLEGCKLPDRSADETEVLARHATAAPTSAGTTADDDGAVPRNLVIPHRHPMPPRRLPTPPVTATAARGNVGLNDFRALLQKVGRA